MNKEELSQLVELYSKFEKDAERVSRILRKSKKQTCQYGNINYADQFRIDGDSVSWEGDEYGSYQYHEVHSGNFPLEYLTMSDEDLNKIVDQENRDYEEEEKQLKKEQEERERCTKLAMFNKLKEELGK